MPDYRRLRVALLGAGAVGSQVAALLRLHSAELADRAGASLELAGIAVRALDGPRVKVVGYLALDTHAGARSFRQTWDQCGCESAKASHFIEVDLGEKTTGYNPDQITVIGTMSVGEQKEDGFVTSLFRLAAESVN